MALSKELLSFLREEFVLDWGGIHGLPHWIRVRENGLRLADSTGANKDVVELFAVLHDCRREDDGFDPDHGERAGQLAASLEGTFIRLPDKDFELLIYACNYHSLGSLHGDPTILTCWDADRLDLGRVGRRPDPAMLCTEAARDEKLLNWAFERSLAPSGR